METVRPIEQQQQKLRVCENTWVGGLKDRGRKKDFKEEIGIQWSVTGILVRHRMVLAGHVVRNDTDC